MQEAWFQIWIDVPVLGRQWGGWLWTTPLMAGAMSLGIKSCPNAGVTILDQNGLPVDTQLGLPPGIDIGKILGGLGGLNWGG